jgi:hypothetical protein
LWEAVAKLLFSGVKRRQMSWMLGHSAQLMPLIVHRNSICLRVLNTTPRL